MCGITGIFNQENAISKIISANEAILNRGKDGFGLVALSSKIKRKEKSDFFEYYAKSLKEIKEKIELDDLNSKLEINNVLSHNLHSIVGNVVQPLKGKNGYLAINCEIYNWEELAKKESIKCNNDAELVLKLIEKNSLKDLKHTLNILDGVYSLAYWDIKNNKVYVARDIIGVKPCWFYYGDGFSFSSERKALYSASIKNIIELNPRKILEYDLKSNKLTKIERSFFSVREQKISNPKQTEIIENNLMKLLDSSIKKRIPDKKLGLLFSGGIDSVFIAQSLKKMGIDFTCYTAAIVDDNFGIPHDLEAAEKATKELGLKLRIKKIKLQELEEYIKKVSNLIEDNNVVKVGVGITLYAACELAKKDNIKVIMSGLGSEEIFAGYDRHKNSININNECHSGLLKIYERDLYRDDVISMNNNMEMRLPFLDKELIKYSLSIPSSLKIDSSGRNKAILRNVAKKIDIPEYLTEKPKKAAQYGSKVDRAIEKLAKQNGYNKKSEYLKQFFTKPNVKLGVMWSGGKDSALATWTMMNQNYEISCFIVMKSKNQDSYMFHTPNMNLTKLHSEASNVPLIEVETEGKKESELTDMKKAIEIAKKEYGIEGITTGAIFSNYQRDRIEKVCDSLELKIFSPLWHMNQENEMIFLLKNKFKFLITKIGAYGLDKTWLGKEITNQDLNKLIQLKGKFKINVAGEGGEFETLILDAPFFEKEIIIDSSTTTLDSENSGVFEIKKAHLKKK